jgi:hypothetical protein
MAARDRYTWSLKCPGCGHSGKAEVSEDDHPYMRDPGFRVDELPSGFKVIAASFWRHETIIGCQCGTRFPLQRLA